jgi:hypothetical protein
VWKCYDLNSLNLTESHSPAGDELSDISFLSFVEELEKMDEDVDVDAEDEGEDDDEYGINDQLQKYVGIRLCGKKKAIVSVDQVEADTWLVFVASESNEDSFCVEGSDTPLWLAFVEYVKGKEKKEEEGKGKNEEGGKKEEGGNKKEGKGKKEEEGEGEGRTLALRWWVPQKGTKTRIENPDGAGKITFQKVTGQRGFELMEGVDHKQLAHINIKTLNGLNNRNRISGKLPKAALKAIANVLLPSEADKIKRICPRCNMDCGLDKGEDTTVECTQCSQCYHLKCSSSEVVEGEWYCEECDNSHDDE